MDAKEICERAASLVAGDRQRTHGDKTANHANIARLWNAYFKNKGEFNFRLSPLDVATMMELLKIARRQCGSHNIEDYIDAAGYAGVAGQIAEEWERTDATNTRITEPMSAVGLRPSR